MKNIPEPEKAVINLIDEVIFGGAEPCSVFLQVLKDPTVLETYPRLKQITEKSY